MKPLKLTILDGLFTIHRLKPGAAIPKAVTSSSFYSISGSVDEISIVALDSVRIESEKSEPGWVVMCVTGMLDFTEVGILAELTSALAKAGISVFAVSTFNTDYLLVKDTSLKAAREVLTAAGHKVSKPRSAKEEEKSSLLKDSAAALLEAQIPQIKKLLVEKVGPSALATLRSPASMAVALGGIYEFLPIAVRLVVNREIFISFCVSNLDQILPPVPAKKAASAPVKKPAPAKKK